VVVSIAKQALKLIGIYNPTDEDVATMCMRLSLDDLPIKVRPFILFGCQLLHTTLIKPPVIDDIEDE
jgi:hypothetical protein